jgi:hypothetical protein
MSAVESTIVFLARPTTLVGAISFVTMPLDTSRYGSVQMQLWRGPIRGGGTFLCYFEESLDTLTWALGPSTPVGYDPADAATGGDPTFASPQLFSYAFRLRWFRLRIALTGSAPIVTCWAEGSLRDGGGGPWNPPVAAARAVRTDLRPATPGPTLAPLAPPAAPEGRAAGGGEAWDPANQNVFANLRDAKC